MSSCVLVMSGGLDSTVSAYLSREQGQPRIALFFDYGQRAAKCEHIAAQYIAERLAVPLQRVEIPWLQELGQSALTDTARPMPQVSTEQLDDLVNSGDSARGVWVPNRNGVFLNIAAAYAESLESDLIITGFNEEEAATFADNSVEFVAAANSFFAYSTLNGVSVVSFTQDWNKLKIVQRGIELDVPFELLWSCYESGDKQCGRCESCARSMRAYQETGMWERMKEFFER